MPPARTSCIGPRLLSPQKPEAPPMRTTLPVVARFHLPVHCGFLLSLNAAMPSRASCVMASRPICPSPNAIASSNDIERIAFIAYRPRRSAAGEFDCRRDSRRSSAPSRSWRHLVDEADLAGPRGIDRVARQAQLREKALRHLRLQHGEHLHREHADLRLGQAEDRVRRGDGEIAHREQAHAAGHAGAVDARDEGHGERAGRAQQVRIGVGRCRVVELEGIGAQVGAGAEGLVARRR